MTIVVGYLAGKVGPSALHLAVRVARMHKTSLTVATIVRRHWPTPSLARVDAEYELWSEQLAAASAREAQRYLRRLADGIEVSYHHRAHRSVSAGLLDVVEELEAGVLVLGSFPSGRRARVLIGSTADRLLHSSPVPVAITPPLPLLHRPVDTAQLRLLRDVGFGRRGEAMRPPGQPVWRADAGDHIRGPRPDHVSARSGAACRGFGSGGMGGASARTVGKLRINGVVSEDVVLQVVTGNGWAQALDAADWQDRRSWPWAPRRSVMSRVFLGSWVARSFATARSPC